MLTCTFFGHRECYGLDDEVLQAAIEKLITTQGVDTFYVGNQGQFDAMVYRCLKQLQKRYPQIHIAVVLAYLPIGKREGEALADSMYPEIEGHPRFAVERRNKWMIGESDYCVCYVNHTWGGAYKFAWQAKRHGLSIINLGKADLKGECDRK